MSDPWVRDRYTRNLAESKPNVSREAFWQTMVSMRLTTQQESGPRSRVAEFNQTHPFALRYELVVAHEDVKRFTGDVLREAGLLRFGKKITDDLSANFYDLQRGEWARALEQCNRLTVLVDRKI